MSSDAIGPEEADRVLRDLEMAHDLFSLTVDGFCAWPILKFEVASLLSALPAAAPTRAPNIRRVLGWAVRDLARLSHNRSLRYLLKTSTATYTDRAGDRCKDYLVDDLVKVLPDAGKLVTVLTDEDASRYRNALISDYLTTTLPQLAGAVHARAAGRIDTQPAADALSTVLRQDVGLSACTAQWVQRRLAHFRGQMGAYRRLLSHVRPRAVLTTDPSEHHIIAAAKQLGILTIELQHGAIWSYHPGYAWGGAAANASGQMPVADRLFAFGEYWQQQLERNAFWRDRIDVTGGLRVDSYRRARLTRTTGPIVRVLFTTQGFDVLASIELVAAALAALPPQLPLSFTFKLHPAYDRDSTPYLERFSADPRVSVVGPAEQPATFDLMIESDLHVSIASTCHFEAVALGVPTVVLPLWGSESTRPMLEKGHAFLAPDGKQLAQLMQNARHLAVPGEASEYYFRPGAATNMKERLETLTS